MEREKVKAEPPLDPDEKTRKRKSRLVKWILNIIDSIVTALT